MTPRMDTHTSPLSTHCSPFLIECRPLVEIGAMTRRMSTFVLVSQKKLMVLHRYI